MAKLSVWGYSRAVRAEDSISLALRWQRIGQRAVSEGDAEAARLAFKRAIEARQAADDRQREES